ncbi:MAG: helix-turn-helix transcriptional regulator [Chloroflexota bacterium]
MALRASKARDKELPTLRELAERRGVSVADLAERSGYTAEHIRRVMRGDHPGSRKFHAHMETFLGGKYRTGDQLALGDAWMPRGFYGNNDLETLMKAQGIKGPQPWPPSRPPEIDDAAMEAFLRAIDEIRR